MGVRLMRKGILVTLSVAVSVAIVGMTLFCAFWLARDGSMARRLDAALRAFCEAVVACEPHG